jgi:alanyl-tRNA synthetase
MNQFKPIFLETVDPSSDLAKLKRAVDTQKCIRAGGKHNDLEDVGHDSYHHTMYSLPSKTRFSWQGLKCWVIGVLGIISRRKRLHLVGNYLQRSTDWTLIDVSLTFTVWLIAVYVTYFEGNEKTGLEPDLETKALWEAIGCPKDHIIPGNMKDNFWGNRRLYEHISNGRNG